MEQELIVQDAYDEELVNVQNVILPILGALRWTSSSRPSSKSKDPGSEPNFGFIRYVPPYYPMVWMFQKSVLTLHRGGIHVRELDSEDLRRKEGRLART